MLLPALTCRPNLHHCIIICQRIYPLSPAWCLRASRALSAYLVCRWPTLEASDAPAIEPSSYLHYFVGSARLHCLCRGDLHASDVQLPMQKQVGDCGSAGNIIRTGESEIPGRRQEKPDYEREETPRRINNYGGSNKIRVTRENRKTQQWFGLATMTPFSLISVGAGFVLFITAITISAALFVVEGIGLVGVSGEKGNGTG